MQLTKTLLKSGSQLIRLSTFAIFASLMQPAFATDWYVDAVNGGGTLLAEKGWTYEAFAPQVPVLRQLVARQSFAHSPVSILPDENNRGEHEKTGLFFDCGCRGRVRLGVARIGTRQNGGRGGKEGAEAGDLRRR